MPSSPFSGSRITHPSFFKHRYNEDHRPLGLQIKLTTSISLPAWASLPTPPMSGTPPPEPPSEPPQSTGRRRKREDSPPPTTQDRPAPPTSGPTSPPFEPPIPRYGELPRPNRPSEQSIMPFPLNIPWEPQPTTTYGANSRTTFSPYAAPPLPGRPQTSPRATRKTKAHVASACVNCKRKHLRCDETRPCRRCVQSGKEDTCKDVEHKKRGRPPLKPDETSSSRLASTGISLPPLGASSGRIGHSSSGLVPLLPTPTPGGRLPFPPYAAPSIASSHAVAQGHFATRPPVFPPIHQPALQLPSTLPPHPYTYAGDPGLPVSQYSNPLFPRRPGPPQMPFAPQQGSYGPVPFQLPPIRPAPAGTTMDPAIAQQQRHSQPPTTLYSQYPPPRPATTQPETRNESGEREAKRPKMDLGHVLGPGK